MITIIITVLLCLVLAKSKCPKDKRMFNIESISYFTSMGIAGLFIGFYISLIIGFCIPTKNVTITECNLKKIDSTFFVGQTLEHGDSYYFFLQDCGENKINKMPANEVEIIENDSVAPRIEYVIDKFENPKNNLWALPTNSKNVIITVPKGAIRVFLNFNLKDARYPDLLFWKNKQA